jgi:ferric-dicitrate binding protein FerR (iron transport regulator)
VEISGEAYFEVAGDSRGPLRVKRGNLIVEAAGGSFDLRAYKEEPLIYATPVEGKLRVKADNEITVGAGDQAVVNGRVAPVKDVHIDGILAWKKGLFSFSHTTLVDALREMSHWYDIQFEFKRIAPDRYVTGVLDRTLSLDQVLKTLTEGRVKYSIDASKRKLTIE